MSNIKIWQGPDGVKIPPKATKPKEIVEYATSLNDKQKLQIISAFKIQAYDMAAEYAWKKAMTKLKETISTLGMRFIGEMLGRPDIDEYSTIDTALTDYATIELAEQLRVINTTGAFKLKQANELITHYFSKNSDEDLDKNSAIQIVKSSIQYILGEEDVSIAIEFSNFRNRLLNETLNIRDSQVDQLLNSPLFYLRTVISILLASIKIDNGARLENSLANLNLLIEHIWKNISETDRWNIGSAYRDVTAAGNNIASSGLKNALLKVGGFDYVPENLRSVTFKKAAQAVIDIHYQFNNFYNEPAVVRKLASLGNTIPAPAFIECIQAYLAVYLGNQYGSSDGGSPIAEEKLSEISSDRWAYYFEKVINNDEVILPKLSTQRCSLRFGNLLNKYGFNNFYDMPKDNKQLYDALLENNHRKVYNLSISMYNKIKSK